MTDNRLVHATYGLTGRELSFALGLKYVGLTIYGIHALVIEIPTFQIVAGSIFATVWAGVVTALAALALAGVIRTWSSGRYRLEKWASAAFVVVFTGYSFALVYRCFLTHDFDSLPLAWVPLVVTILPTFRYFSLVRRGVGYPKRARRWQLWRRK